ncbi:MAG: glycosyltransferase family 1 protein, partial [Acidobacteria bacterium]|nr:glycosyltransferase family 1 protein [Acidobacteriota bacterium]
RGALPEVVGEAGTLIDPEDTADLARAIDSLLDDPGLRIAHVAAGIERAREFSWRASAGRLLEAYREVLARRRSMPA